jgi:large subunit ribosomal protein L9
MKVILFKAVENLGRPGDIVEVKKGYFRNFLGPREIGEAATASNLKRLTAKRRILESQAAEEVDAAKARIGDIEGLEVRFAMRADEKDHLYGSVGVADIARALEEKDVEIPRRDILLANPIKALGESQVELRLHPTVTAAIKVVVEKAEE